MNENIEAKAQELDPTRSRTIGSYVIGTHSLTQEKHSVKVPSAKSSLQYIFPLAKKWPLKYFKNKRL